MKHAKQPAQLGELIRQSRVAHQWSYRQLCSKSGLAYTTVYRLEAGAIARPRPDILVALSQALEIPLADLMAAANYSDIGGLPSIAPYLRARYSAMSTDNIRRIVLYMEELANKDGIDLSGPKHKEDEKK